MEAHWRSAWVWAIPFVVWAVVGIGGATLAMPASEAWHQASSTNDDIREVEKTHDAERIDLLPSWKESRDADRRKALGYYAAMLAVLAIEVGAIVVYRKRVPRERRGGWRAWVVAAVLLVVLGVGGYLALSVMLRGVIKG